MGDASEFVAPWIDMALGLHKAAKYEGYRLAAALRPRLSCRRGTHRLKLKLGSKKIDSTQVYQIAGQSEGSKPWPRKSTRQSS
jgi:hypothetical protein